MRHVYFQRTDTPGATPDTRYLAPLSGNDWSSAFVSNVVAGGGSFGNLTVARVSSTVSNIASLILTGPGTAITETYTLWKNGSPTSVTCSLDGNTAIADAFASTTEFASFTAGDELTLVRTTSGGTPSNSAIALSFVWDSDSPQQTVYGAQDSVTDNVSVTYVSPLGSGSGFTSTSTDAFATGVIPAGTTIKALYVQTQTIPGATASQKYSVIIYKNGTAQDGTGGTPNTLVEATGSGTPGSAPFTYSTTFELSTTVGDLLQVRITPSGSPDVVSMSIGMLASSTLNGHSITSTYIDSTSTSTTYHAFGQTGSNNQSIPQLGMVGQIYEDRIEEDPSFALSSSAFFEGGVLKATNQAPGAGTSIAFTVHTDSSIGGYPGAVDTSDNFANTLDDTITVSNTDTTGSSADDFTCEQGTFLLIKRVKTGSAALVDASLSWDQFIDPEESLFGGTVDSIAPDTGTIDGGTNFTITGTSFPTSGLSSTEVFLNGVAATSVLVVNSTTITGTSGDTTSAATGDVVVRFTETGGDILVGTLEGGWTYSGSPKWWVIENPTPEDLEAAGLPANTPTSNGPVYVYANSAPNSNWTEATGGDIPSDFGWWWSENGFAGSPQVTEDDGNPALPRTFTQIASLATGTNLMLGGSPGSAATWHNKILYPPSGYVVGTDNPPVHIFDGRSDRRVFRVPVDADGDPAEAVLSMLAANDKVYFSTLDDTGGRVFEYDPLTNTLAQLGAAFTDRPYALAWHMGRLWCGTHLGSGSAGDIFFFRPGVDTSWTSDYDLATSTAGGACCMVSFQGQLYVGTNNAAGSSGKVLVRDTAGAYTTSLTGSGTDVNNSFLALIEFEDRLYTSYWSATSPTTIIRRMAVDGSSWSTVFTGSGVNQRAFMAAFTHTVNDIDYLYFLGGQLPDDSSALVRTADGSNWTSLTTYMVDGTVKVTTAFGKVSF